MNTFRDYVEALLPLLRCPVCHSCRTLEIKSGSAKANTPIQLCDKHLLCRDCNIEYPITEDYIPIMWDADLRRIYADKDIFNSEVFFALMLMWLYMTVSLMTTIFFTKEPTNRKKNAICR